MKNLHYILIALFIAGLSQTSCVSKKTFMASEARNVQLTNNLNSTREELKDTEDRLNATEKQLKQAQRELQESKDQIETLNTRLNAALTTSSSQKAELSAKERALLEQQERLNRLQNLFDEQREVMDRLKTTVDRALNQYKADELEVYEKDGKLYVSLLDKLLFPSGSATVNRDGVEALGKLADVLNASPDIQIMVEGHTDSIPIRGRFEDNWALSTARAASIVRILTNNYKVTPERVIAAGHSYYDPKDSNETAEGRAKNRRTEIILTPKLEELYQILR